MEVFYSKNRVKPVVLKEGSYKKYAYKILCNGRNPTAYVRLLKSHNLNKYSVGTLSTMFDRYDIALNVHGGVTAVFEKDGTIWVGWDYAHAPHDFVGEMVGTSAERNPNFKRWSVSEIMYDVYSAVNGLISLNT